MVIFGLLWQETWQDMTAMREDIKRIQKAYDENIEVQTITREIVNNSVDLNNMLDIIIKRKADLVRVYGFKLNNNDGIGPKIKGSYPLTQQCCH